MRIPVEFGLISWNDIPKCSIHKYRNTNNKYTNTATDIYISLLLEEYIQYQDFNSTDIFFSILQFGPQEVRGPICRIWEEIKRMKIVDKPAHLIIRLLFVSRKKVKVLRRQCCLENCDTLKTPEAHPQQQRQAENRKWSREGLSGGHPWRSHDIYPLNK